MSERCTVSDTATEVQGLRHGKRDAARSRQEWPERALRPIRRKTVAPAEVLIQLPLEIVRDAPAMLRDKPPGLALDTALLRTVKGRENARNNSLARARGRALRRSHVSAAQVKAPV
jgi:hypothetical protein